MKTVGDIIKEARLSRGLSIEQISNELKISKYIIEKIEEDSVKQETDFVYIIGHLRSYLNFMDLDSDYLIRQFKNQLSFKKDIFTKNIKKPNIDPTIFNFQKIISGSLILIIFISFYYLFIFESNDNIQYALIPDIPESAIPIVEKLSLEKEPTSGFNQEFEELNNNNFENFSSVNASSDISTSANSEIITLKLLNSTWIQLRDSENNIIISRLMEKNEEYSYNINLKYSITAGNAGNILVIVNEDVRGKIGKYGEVVDSFIVDNKFYN